MKRTRVILSASTIVGLSVLAAAQIGGGYDLTHSTHESSGRLSTSASYQLQSAVHQPIAELSSPSTGGTFSLTSGFLTLPQQQVISQPYDLWAIK